MYIDSIANTATPVLSNVGGMASTQNFIFFGHDTSALKGRTEWDYVRWTKAGAFTVPEPGTLTLLLGALVWFGLMRR